MNRKTLATVSSIVNKSGNNLNLVQWVSGKPFIYGVPVKLCPSMDNIGVSNVPVILGDGANWATRLCCDETSGIGVLHGSEWVGRTGTSPYVDILPCGRRLLYTDTNSPAPFTYIRNHS